MSACGFCICEAMPSATAPPGAPPPRPMGPAPTPAPRPPCMRRAAAQARRRRGRKKLRASPGAATARSGALPCWPKPGPRRPGPAARQPRRRVGRPLFLPLQTCPLRRSVWAARPAAAAPPTAVPARGCPVRPRPPLGAPLRTLCRFRPPGYASSCALDTWRSHPSPSLARCPGAPQTASGPPAAGLPFHRHKSLAPTRAPGRAPLVIALRACARARRRRANPLRPLPPRGARACGPCFLLCA
jgi:hypothetical protein